MVPGGSAASPSAWSAARPASTITGSLASIVSFSSLTLDHHLAAAGLLGLLVAGAGDVRLRSASLAWSRSTPRAASALAAAVSGSARAASSRWCEPTGCAPASRAASLRLVSAAGVVRSSVCPAGSPAARGSPSAAAPQQPAAAPRGL